MGRRAFGNSSGAASASPSRIKVRPRAGAVFAGRLCVCGTITGRDAHVSIALKIKSRAAFVPTFSGQACINSAISVRDRTTD